MWTFGPIFSIFFTVEGYIEAKNVKSGKPKIPGFSSVYFLAQC